MKTIITSLFLLFTASLFAQTKIDNGIYQGFKFPFLNCLLNIKDTLSTVDVFFCNTGHYFGHLPTKKLTSPIGSTNEKNLVLIYKNDSVKVYKNKSNLKVKIKGHGFVKMQLTNYNDSIISSSLNNHLDFHCYHQLLHELKHKPNFSHKKFSEIYHSYKIETFYTINTADFRKKLNEIEIAERSFFK